MVLQSQKGSIHMWLVGWFGFVISKRDECNAAMGLVCGKRRTITTQWHLFNVVVRSVREVVDKCHVCGWRYGRL